MYNSLFDRIPGYSYLLEAPAQMQFEGNLSEVLHSLLDSDTESEKGVLNRMLMAPRVLRSALDFQCETKRGLRLVQGATNLLKDAYAKDCLEESLQSYASLLSDFGINPDATHISQRLDHLSWNSYASHRTDGNVEFISSKGSLCLIALGHGGLGVGMDLYLRLQDKNPFTEYSFYPVRFSRTKLLDTVPNLSSKSVVNYIESISEGKEIVIFDEDENSGNTLAIAQAFFEKKFPNRIISSKSNYRTANYDLKKQYENKGLI